MFICSAQNLAFVSVPKTGSTAIRMALRPYADIMFTRWRRHMSAQKFGSQIAPFLKESLGLNPDRFAVMREPEEQIRSWYRYRMRESNSDRPTSTSGMDFDQFVLDALSDDPPSHARIGTQWRMLAGGDELLVHHLFAYETPNHLHGFLNERFGTEIGVKSVNVSPPVDAPLSEKTRQKLRRARQSKYVLYDMLMEAGGHLENRF